MTEELSGLMLVALAVYVAMVVANGNTSALFHELSKEKGYVPWALSLAIVYWLWKSNSAGKIIGAIAGIGLLATLFVILQSGKIKSVLE